MDEYFVYIIETVSNTLYCGIAKDVIKRWKCHTLKKGAKYLSSHEPKKIVFIKKFENKSLALKEEYRIKNKLTRKQKLSIIEENKIITNDFLKKFNQEVLL